MTRVLFASSEMYPLVKTGGLGDVSNSLPQALQQAGTDIRVVIPGYPDVLKAVKKSKVIAEVSGFMIPDNTRVIQARLPGTRLTLWIVDCAELFVRSGGPYVDTSKQEWPDNARRFAVFSRVIAELALGRLDVDWRPDVVHCNDWQTGLVPALLSLSDERPASVFTIHNLAYQGNFSREVFDSLMLPPAWWSIEGIEFYNNMSFLKAGIVFADQVTTVSPTYAKEILTREFGFGMEGLLQHVSPKLTGVLNGADYETWNPASDPFVKFHYDADTLEEKLKNKLDLQRHFGLKLTKGTPLFGIVSRLVHQKGIDLVLQAIRQTLDDKVQWMILGSGDDEFERELKKLSESHPEKICFTQGYNEALAHRIEASVDVFVMPSRFEPCGLNQIYSLRYGTLPLVRATGGLADTVTDLSQTSPADGGNGFVFTGSSADELVAAVQLACSFYRKKKQWRLAQQSAMARDFGWSRSAARYREIYERSRCECREGQCMTE